MNELGVEGGRGGGEMEEGKVLQAWESAISSFS